MPIWQEYILAESIEDAIQALEQAPQLSCVIAGGTDLLLDLQQGRHAPVHTLVDITNIPEMNDLAIRQESLYIGAAVPLNQVLASPLVKQHAEALFEAVSLIGGPQVRNTATLGGNVGHGLPAGDGTIALLALQAMAEIAGPGGRRVVPVQEQFLGPGKSILPLNNEILLGFYLPLKSARQGSAFRRIMRPQGVGGHRRWRHRRVKATERGGFMFGDGRRAARRASRKQNAPEKVPSAPPVSCSSDMRK